MAYEARKFDLKGLQGISDETLELHFKLYAGYVKGTNALNERIEEFLKDGKVDQEEMPAYSELTRRLGFEYNGMVLHEYYFGNMKSRGGDDAPKGSQFREAVERSFPSYEIWRTDFVSVGKMRGASGASVSSEAIRRSTSSVVRRSSETAICAPIFVQGGAAFTTATNEGARMTSAAAISPTATKNLFDPMRSMTAS